MPKRVVILLIHFIFDIFFVFVCSCIATSHNTTAGSGGPHTTSTPTGNRRQQYTLAELPYVCEFCHARYKTKPGLQYHLAKHKESNSDYRPSPSTPSTADSGGSSSPSSANPQPPFMKQKYMSPPVDHHQQQQQQQPQPQQSQHSMYPSHPAPGGPPPHNPSSGGK